MTFNVLFSILCTTYRQVVVGRVLLIKGPPFNFLLVQHPIPVSYVY